MNAFRRSWGWVVSDGESSKFPRVGGPYIEHDTQVIVFDAITADHDGVSCPHNWMIVEFKK